MNILLFLIFFVIILAGGIYAGFARDPYAKLIGIGLIGGGVMPLIIARGYVDVATALSKVDRAVLVGNLSPSVSFPLQKVVTRELKILGSCAIRGEYEAVLDLMDKAWR